MGCGGSRADAIIEPRYHESWTRETESTWLTNTDVEASFANGKSSLFFFYLLLYALHARCCRFAHNADDIQRKRNQLSTSCALSITIQCRVHNSPCVFKVSMNCGLKGKALESSLREKRMVTTGTQCGKQPLTSTSSNHQRRPRRSLTEVGEARFKETWFHVRLQKIIICLYILGGQGRLSKIWGLLN